MVESMICSEKTEYFRESNEGYLRTDFEKGIERKYPPKKVWETEGGRGGFGH